MQPLKQPKEPHKVMVILDKYRIEGFIHMMHGQRLTDFANSPRNFIPLTDVKIFKTGEEHEFAKTNLLELNIHEIQMFYLAEESPEMTERETKGDKNIEDTELQSMYVDPFKPKTN